MNLESIDNFYEFLVSDYIQENLAGKYDDEEFLVDVACVALNQLPARYVRHRVDLMFFMPFQERTKMEADVVHAVKTAIEFVEKHRRKRPDTITQ